MKFKLLAMLFVMVCVLDGWAGAQQTCADRVNALTAEMNANANSVDSTVLSDIYAGQMNYLMDCLLWNPEMHKMLANYETEAQPIVSMDMSDSSLRTPHIDGSKIDFPIEFALYLNTIGVFLGHDAYVRNGLASIDFPNPLVTTPYRRTMVAPLFMPFGNFVTADTFAQFKSKVQCPPTDNACGFIEGLGFQVPVLFVLLHEDAHIRLHHVNVSGLDPTQEIAADASALSAMKILGDAVSQGMDEPAKSQIQWLFEAAPALWLRADVDREGKDGLGTVAAQRLQAVLLFDPTLTRALTRYVTAEHQSNSLRTLKLDINHPVTWFVIDGIKVNPTLFPATTLTVTNTNHTVVALCPDGIGVKSGSEDVDYVFVPRGDVTADTLQQDEAAGNWAALLGETSNGDLSPKSDAVIWLQSEALHRLSLDSLISDRAAQILQGDQLSSVQQWQQNAVPLAGWR